MKTLIGGIGYFNLSDFSLGPIVIEALRQQRWPDHVEVQDLSYGGPIAAVHRFREASPPYDRLVLVGAADRGLRDPNPRCYRWDGILPPPDEVQARVGESVTGVLDLDSLLIVTKQFGVLPEEVFVVEVQPIATGSGLETSPQVQAVLPEICRMVRCLAQAPPAEVPRTVSGMGGLISVS